jgi:hypothetical protein
MARTPASKPKANRQDTDPAKTAKPGQPIGDAASDSVPAGPPTELYGDGGLGSYAVGYGRPPLASRFKPGQSGNPKGREKQSRNMRTIMQQVLNEDMQIREGGRPRRMPTFEALVRTILSRAFKGDPKAMASLLVLVRHCGYGTDHDEPAAELLSGSDLTAIIADYIDRNAPETRPAAETATAKGISPTEPSTPPTTPPKNPR